MSTDPASNPMDQQMAQAKALVEAARMHEAEQLDLLGVVTPEDMVEAREELGAAASHMSVLRKARERQRGRPPGSRNKRTDDFAKYLLGFGQHPAITMMQIQSTPPEVLIEASRRLKVHSYRKDGTPNIVEEQMSYSEAQALRTRCAENLLPYLESKKPVAVDLTFADVSDLVIEGLTHSSEETADIVNADFYEVPTTEMEGGE